jgi:hypothetical protein
MPAKVSSLAYDYLDSDNVLRLLYENDKFLDFLRQVLDLPALFR